jgi:PQQ-like domain
MRKWFVGVSLVSVAWASGGLSIGSSPAKVQVATAHFDNLRNGWNPYESHLTPAVVQGATFKRQWAYSVDGYVYAQPLYLPNITVSGALHDLLIVSTMNNSIYAFDAGSNTSLWHTTVGSPMTSYPNQGGGSDPLFYGNPVGCVSTPVADIADNLLFSVCATATPSWVLRSINLSTGAVVSNVTISGQVVGTGDSGDPTSGPNLLFYPLQELQRSALTFANNRVYVTFGSYSDIRPWHGWAFAYSTALSQVGIFCTSPNEYGAGLWGASGGFSSDGTGLYMETGNGDWNPSIGQYGESILKFDASLNLLDYFTPSNWATLNGNDSDLSSSRAMLISGLTWLVAGAKDFRGYLVGTENMGHLQGSGVTNQQLWYTNAMGSPGGHAGIYGGAYGNGRVYLPNTGGTLYSYPFNGSTFDTSAVVTSSASFPFPGIQVSGSGGPGNGLVWGVAPASNAADSAQSGTLYAFDPATLDVLYSSANVGGDGLGTMAKYSVPLVANGRVYVGTAAAVVVYGTE